MSADASIIIDWQPMLKAALVDLRAGAPPGLISGAFHHGLANVIKRVAARVGEQRVILTGGCFQNARLTVSAVAALRSSGFEPVWHQRVPPNDGGLALGQAAWAAWTEQREASPCA
jgi:hydrogenase maturation protein HypF